MLERPPTGSHWDAPALRRPLLPRLAVDRHTWQAAAGYALPFLLVLYLGLKGGGYDAVVRSEIGVAAWWLVLLGVIVGVLPTAHVPRAAWIGLGLLAAFGLWTAAGISWSESSERATAELARVATLLGVFALAAFVQGRDSLRRTAIGAAAAIAADRPRRPGSRACIQTGSRRTCTTNAVGEHDRLNYPLNYWNGLASLLAIGVPLLLVVAVQARHVVARAIAAAAIPALALAAFYTFSRGGAAEVAIALIVLFALHPRRLELLPVTALAGLRIVSPDRRRRRSATPSRITSARPRPRNQGDEMIALVIVVCAGVALLQTALALAARHGIGPRIAISRQGGHRRRHRWGADCRHRCARGRRTRRGLRPLERVQGGARADRHGRRPLRERRWWRPVPVLERGARR